VPAPGKSREGGREGEKRGGGEVSALVYLSYQVARERTLENIRLVKAAENDGLDAQLHTRYTRYTLGTHSVHTRHTLGTHLVKAEENDGLDAQELPQGVRDGVFDFLLHGGVEGGDYTKGSRVGIYIHIYAYMYAYTCIFPPARRGRRR